MQQDNSEVLLESAPDYATIKAWEFSISGRPTLYIEAEDRAHNKLETQIDYYSSIYLPFLEIYEYDWDKANFVRKSTYQTYPSYEFEGELNKRTYRFLIRLYDKMPLETEYTQYDEAIATVNITAPHIQKVVIQDCKERVSDSDSLIEYDLDPIYGQIEAVVYLSTYFDSSILGKTNVKVKKIEVYYSYEDQYFETDEEHYLKTYYPDTVASYYRISISEITPYVDCYFKFIAYDDIGPGNTAIALGYLCPTPSTASCLTVRCIDFLIDTDVGDGVTYIEENTAYLCYTNECPQIFDGFYSTDWTTAYYNISAISEGYGSAYTEYPILVNRNGQFKSTSVGGAHIVMNSSKVSMDINHYSIAESVALCIAVKGPAYEGIRVEASQEGNDWESIYAQLEEYKDQELRYSEIKTALGYYETVKKYWYDGNESVIVPFFTLKASQFLTYVELKEFSLLSLGTEEGANTFLGKKLAICYLYEDPNTTEAKYGILGYSEMCEQEEYLEAQDFTYIYTETDKSTGLPTEEVEVEVNLVSAIKNVFRFKEVPQEYFGENGQDLDAFVLTKTMSLSDSLIYDKENWTKYGQYRYYLQFCDEEGNILEEQPKFFPAYLQKSMNGFDLNNKNATAADRAYYKEYWLGDPLTCGQFLFENEEEVDSYRRYNIGIASSIVTDTEDDFWRSYSFPYRGVRPPQTNFKSKFGDSYLTEETRYIFDGGWVMMGDFHGKDVMKMHYMAFIVPNEIVQQDIYLRKVRLEFHYRTEDGDTVYWMTSGEAQKDSFEIDGVTYYAIKFDELNLPVYGSKNETGWTVYAIEQDDTVLLESFPVCVSNDWYSTDETKYDESSYLSIKNGKYVIASGGTKEAISPCRKYASQVFGAYSFNESTARKYQVQTVTFGSVSTDEYNTFLGTRIGFYALFEPYWTFKKPVEVKALRTTY